MDGGLAEARAMVSEDLWQQAQEGCVISETLMASARETPMFVVVAVRGGKMPVHR